MGKKKVPVPWYQQHAITVVASAIVPALLPAGPGLSLIPAIILALSRVRWLYVRYWGVVPVVSLIAALEGVDSVLNAVLPLALMVALHYYAVSKAAEYRTSKRTALDTFADSVSGYLNQKCYVEKAWPKFLHMKSERVLISLSCIFKMVASIAFLIFFGLTQGMPKDPLDCAASSPRGLYAWTWVMYSAVALTEILYHCAMYLSNTIHNPVVNSFALPVLQPTYWQWYLIAQYGPTHGIWVPLVVENIRTISVSFFRMQDRDDTVVAPLMAVIDVLHALVVIAGSSLFGCSYPVAMLYRQILNGTMFVQSVAMLRLKKWRTWSVATKKVRCRLYFPVAHPEIECHKGKWQAGVTLPEDTGPVVFPKDHYVTKKYGDKIKVTYHKELALKRLEKRPDWESEVPSFVTFERRTIIPGSWVCLEVEAEHSGLCISEKEMNTELEGQFRVLHPLLDTKGLLAYWGDFQGKLFCAKRYKKDPQGGWDTVEVADESTLSEAEQSAIHNKHVRLLKPLFQDCLMQEKAAELGKAFNAVENLPVKKIDVLRACIMETGWEELRPQIYLLEPFLDDNSPFRKFNNNDFVPGAQAVQNTPNMYSLFSYFHSNKKLLVCDIQGKKYRFTDPQFHTSEKQSIDDDDYDEGELRDWLHSDGGLEMMKRVLLGLHAQQSLHALCDRIWPEQMAEFNRQVEEWKSDPEFAKQMEEWEKEAKLYSKYFSNLNPVLDAGVGTYNDMEEELSAAMLRTKE